SVARTLRRSRARILGRMATSRRSSADRGRLLAALLLVGFCAGCPDGNHHVTKPTTEADHMKESVNAVFERLAQGRLSQPQAGPADGWRTALPDGKTVARSTLQAEAKPLIDLGSGAVPDLLPWVHHENAALRYVAMFALETITSEHPRISYFD